MFLDFLCAFSILLPGIQRELLTSSLLTCMQCACTIVCTSLAVFISHIRIKSKVAPGTDFLLSVPDCWLLCLLCCFAAGYLLLTASCSLPAAGGWLLLVAACWLLSGVCCWLLIGAAFYLSVTASFFAFSYLGFNVGFCQVVFEHVCNAPARQFSQTFLSLSLLTILLIHTERSQRA